MSRPDEQNEPVGSFNVYGKDLKVQTSVATNPKRKDAILTVDGKQFRESKKRASQSIILLGILCVACLFLLGLSILQNPVSGENPNVPNNTTQKENVENPITDEVLGETLVSVNVRMVTFNDKFTAEYVLAQFQSSIGGQVLAPKRR